MDSFLQHQMKAVKKKALVEYVLPIKIEEKIVLTIIILPTVAGASSLLLGDSRPSAAHLRVDSL